MKKIWNVLALLLNLLILSACGDNNTDEQNFPTVEVIKVFEQNIPLNLEYSGRTQGSKETAIRARVGGILLKRHYQEGEQVNEGDVLFEIDPEPYKVVLAQAEAKLAQIQAKLTSAKAQWERIDKLAESHIVSERSRDEAKAEYDSLVASSELASAEVDSARLNLDYATVTAPIAGITDTETVSEGSLIAVNDQLTTITQLDPIYVVFSVSENEVMKLSEMISKDMLVNTSAAEGRGKEELDAKVRFSNNQFYSETGKVNFIDSSLDRKTGTLKLRATFPNAEHELIPGQFVHLIVDHIARQNAVTIPSEALMQGTSGAYVYRVSKENKVERVAVKADIQTTDERWIIDEGLKAGDVIITKGMMKVRPGMRVKTVIKDEKTQSAEHSGYNVQQ